MMQLSLSGSRSHDPVADATRSGKIPTLGEVKRSLKVLIIRFLDRFIWIEYCLVLNQEPHSSNDSNGLVAQYVLRSRHTNVA